LNALVEWEGTERPAVVFGVSKPRTTISLLAGVGLIALGFFAIADGRDRLIQVVGVFLVALSLISLYGALNGLRGRAYLALITGGILWRTPAGSSFVRWETIETVGHYQVSWQRFLGLKTSVRPRITGGVMRAFGVIGRLDRRLMGWDVGYPLWLIERSGEFEELVTRCVTQPEARTGLGQQATT